MGTANAGTILAMRRLLSFLILMVTALGTGCSDDCTSRCDRAFTACLDQKNADHAACSQSHGDCMRSCNQ